jgi:hypothetical protein
VDCACTLERASTVASVPEQAGQAAGVQEDGASARVHTALADGRDQVGSAARRDR